MKNPGIKESVAETVQAVAADLGYMIYELHIMPKGANSRILARIDHLRGVSIEDCESFSRELSRRLDQSQLLPNYTLEISSPGINRLLRNPAEFERFRGAPVKVIYASGEQQLVCKGILEDVNDARITLKSEGKELIVGFGDIKSANLDY